MSDVKNSGMASMDVGHAVDLLSKAYVEVINKGLPVKTVPSVMLWGPPGVGKSQAVRQLAEKIQNGTGKKTRVTDVRLLLFNPIDLRGIPTANADKTLAVWLKPQIFQMDESKDVVNILLLDEIESAATDGERIIFAPSFLDDLSDKELDFIMMHEVMHMALRHTSRLGDRDPELFNIACDIVVNSNIMKSNGMDLDSITLKKYGPALHELPDGRQGYEMTSEETYAEVKKYILIKKAKEEAKSSERAGGGAGGSRGKGRGYHDDHSRWGKKRSSDRSDDWDDYTEEMWKKWLRDACETMKIRDPDNSRGLVPACAQREYLELTEPKLDWKTVLTNFVQENVKDYTLCPPDRRYGDSPFFLPDFNDQDGKDAIHKVLFMIDTSGSISDEMMTEAYSEVKGAVDQFDGGLDGWLGFFDAMVYEPVPFCDEEELKAIRPRGGGGTSFGCIFQYVKEHMQEEFPSNIVILTDGYAPFPDERAAMDIPVLWVMASEVKPPWGKWVKGN